MDTTFKVAAKTLVVDQAGKRHRIGKGGVLSILNENSEVIGWVSSSQIMRFIITKLHT